MVQDRELVARCLAGEAEAFHGLVTCYQDRVYRVALRYLGNRDDAMETAQEAFTRAFAKLETFDLERNFATWLLSVTANLARDVLRRRKRRPEVLDNERLVREPGGEAPGALAAQREEAERLRALVQTLDPDKRMAVVLRYFEGLSLSEVAEVTGTDPNTLKVRLFRARKELLAKLDPGGGNE